MNREYHRWYNPRLNRDMELLIFGHGGAKVLVFPTRSGRFHEYEDLRIVYYNNPCHFLPNLGESAQLHALRAMDIVLVVGRDDPFLENNRLLSRVLWEKGVRHQLSEWDGRAHQGRAWRKMAPLYV